MKPGLIIFLCLLFLLVPRCLHAQVTAVCVGSTITVSDPVSGGAWSSSNTAVATVSSGSGLVTGISSGTATMSYTVGISVTTKSVTVNPTPAAITGYSLACAGTAVTQSDATTGGAWSSSNTTVATIGSGTGVVVAIFPGTSTITYKMPTGCAVTTMLTVTFTPSVLVGLNHVCMGLTTMLSDIGGGSWSSSNTGVATIGSSTGMVTGVTPGTSTITYSVGSGCATTTTFTVYPLPPPIVGALTVCAGQWTLLRDAVGGGTWASSNTAVATVGTGGGLVTAISPGTSTISYTVATGCSTTANVTVPGNYPITGSTVDCIGRAEVLSDASSGGTWTSSNTAVATIVPGTGMLTGLAIGTSEITYMIPAGCMAFTTVTITPLPSVIIGASSICTGEVFVLTDAVKGGTWSSSDTFVATVDQTAGFVFALTPGVAVVTYTMGASCYTIHTVTVSGVGPITGSMVICDGMATLLSDAGSGTWSSSNTAVARIGLISGIVTALSAGTSQITYTIPAGCLAITTVTVIPPPSMIMGPASVCQGASILLNDLTKGGTWSSADTTVAFVGLSTGLVTGISSGPVSIYYAATPGCVTIKTVTVDPLASISGSPTVCVGATTSLTDTVLGGTWASSNTAVATVASGLVTGVSTGTAIVTYKLPTGCTATTIITVLILPKPITGPATVCPGYSISLHDATPGGLWSSGNTSVATVVPLTALVTGVVTGTAIITYSDGGCFTHITVLVSPIGPITGTKSICVGATTALTDTVSGGTWTSGNTAVAAVDLWTGVATGVSTGTALITYTTPAGCTAIATISVLLSPMPISCASAVCIGTSIALSDGVTGGTWSCFPMSVATIGFAGLTGVSLGTATLTYSLGSGCIATKIITVVAALPAITGPTAVCVGATIAVSDVATGGAWTSGKPAVATIGASTGLVTGVSMSTATITYSVGAGCTTTEVVIVVPVPTAISGIFSVCTGPPVALSNSVAGGIWISGNTAVADIGLYSGILTGISAGTSHITYSLGTGCGVMVTETVTPVSAIIGSTTVCVGLTTALSDAATGGKWSSSNTAVATVGSGSGMVSGISAGSSTVTYMLPTGCLSTTIVTVTSGVPAITGVLAFCKDAVSGLSDIVAGGTWNSSNSSIASIDPLGVVTGAAAGTATISYSLGIGCSASAVVTVYPLPFAVTGSPTVCLGLTTTLSDATGGGSWVSVDPAVATVGSVSGLVTGVSGGTTTISYTLITTGCSTTKTETVNTVPVISGLLVVCNGLTTALTDTTGGGTWTSSNTAIATVGSGSGIVSALTAGTSAISYTTPAGCLATSVVTVNALPSAITGITHVCAASATTLSDAVSGGSWNSSNSVIASVGTGSGIVTGLSAGTTTISYALGTGCMVTTVVTVNPLPMSGAITGKTSVCAGDTIILKDAATGGTWGVTNGDARILAGAVTGIIAGTDTVKYSVTNTCGTATATLVVTVSSLPVVAAITGTDSVCVGDSVSLVDATIGGAWSSSDNTLATIAAGEVTGISAGIDTIFYTVRNTCGNTVTEVAVNIISCLILDAGKTINTGSARLKVEPNPNNGSFAVNLLSGSDELVQITISDLLGRKITEFTTGTNKPTDVKITRPPGIYLLSASTPHGRYDARIVIE